MRVTQSDAKAVLRSVGSAAEPEAAIRPFQFDGRHYCVLDWHVALLTFVEGGDASFTRKDAEASLNLNSATFVLNGTVLGTERTKIKRYPDPSRFGFVEAYYFQQGRILSPDDLAVGQHTLSASGTDSRGPFEFTTSFFIDAAGTGACL